MVVVLVVVVAVAGDIAAAAAVTIVVVVVVAVVVVVLVVVVVVVRPAAAAAVVAAGNRAESRGWKGDACTHCHFCTPEEAKVRRRELQDKALVGVPGFPCEIGKQILRSRRGSSSVCGRPWSEQSVVPFQPVMLHSAVILRRRRCS